MLLDSWGSCSRSRRLDMTSAPLSPHARASKIWRPNRGMAGPHERKEGKEEKWHYHREPHQRRRWLHLLHRLASCRGRPAPPHVIMKFTIVETERGASKSRMSHAISSSRRSHRPCRRSLGLGHELLLHAHEAFFRGPRSRIVSKPWERGKGWEWIGLLLGLA
jgi:hypothetical protein